MKLIHDLISDKSTPPHLKSLAHREYGDWLMGRGKYSEATEEYQQLHYITQWMLAGPFDNRDNSGFVTAYEPETQIDFEKNVPGRNRAVNWFRPAAQPIDGKMSLAQLFEPHIHVIAYAVTFVKAETAGWSVARCGAAGALEFWVNGQKAGSIDDHNDWGDDKLAVPVYLEKGWNEVLVKSAVVEDTAWIFSLRFCDRSMELR